MRSWIINISLLGAVALVAALGLVFGRRDISEPHFEVMPDMVHSIPYDAFSANRDALEGRALGPAVPGTIPRGFMPVHYEATKEDAARAGEELNNPFQVTDDEAVGRGQFVFATFCTPCHGGDGMGTGPVVMRGFPAPPPLTGETVVNMKDGQMFHVITYGGENMPPHAAQVSAEDRWKAILHMRVLQAASGSTDPDESQVLVEQEEGSN